MTKWRMTLTRTDDAPRRIYQRRIELAKTDNVTNSGLYDDQEIAEALSRHAASAVSHLDAKAAKAGLKPSKDETHYGIHGAGDGPIEFWVQRSYA